MSIKDEIAQTVINTFNELKFTRPLPGEWTVLAGIVLESPGNPLKCVSLATGLDALNHLNVAMYKISDSHAEVLCRRSFRCWLVQQLKNNTIFDTENGIKKLKKDCYFYMYISQSPCGTASMSFLESIETHQDKLENTQKRLKFLNSNLKNHAFLSDKVVRGRMERHLTRVPRTKPGRMDSIESYSMSCSDKITRWSVCGLQGNFLTGIMEPIFLSRLVIGDGFDENALMEMFQRVALPSHVPILEHTKVIFEYSQTQFSQKPKSCPRSKILFIFTFGLVWNSIHGHQVLVKGIRQGSRASDPKSRYKIIHFMNSSFVSSMSYCESLQGMLDIHFSNYKDLKKRNETYEKLKLKFNQELGWLGNH